MNIKFERRILSIKNYYKVVFREEILIAAKDLNALDLIRL